MEPTSSGPIRALVLDDSPQSGDIIASLLRAEPGFAVTVSAMAFGEGIRATRRHEPDVIIFVTDSLVASDAIFALDELEGAAPNAAIIVLTSDDTAKQREFILAGARDCLTPPYTRESLVKSARQVYLHESRRRERLAANISGGLRRHRCEVIAFHGAKGGVGTTLVATNVAVGLREITKERVAVVDASLQVGDVGAALNVVSSTGIDDLVPHLNELDADLLSKVLVRHASGVQVLLAPRDLERAEAVTGDVLRRVLTFLSGHFDYIIVDTAPNLDAAGLATLDNANRIILLTAPDILSLKNAGRFLQLSRRLGYPDEKIGLVVNHANSNRSIKMPEIEKRLGIKAIGTIPRSDREFFYASNNGEIVISRAVLDGAGRSLYHLANRLAIHEEAPAKKGIFARVGRIFPPSLGLAQKGKPENVAAPNAPVSTNPFSS